MQPFKGIFSIRPTAALKDILCLATKNLSKSIKDC